MQSEKVHFLTPGNFLRFCMPLEPVLWATGKTDIRNVADCQTVRMRPILPYFENIVFFKFAMQFRLKTVSGLKCTEVRSKWFFGDNVSSNFRYHKVWVFLRAEVEARTTVVKCLTFDKSGNFWTKM